MASTAIEHNFDLNPDNADGVSQTLHQLEPAMDVNGYAESNERGSFWMNSAYRPQAQWIPTASMMTIAAFVENFFVPEHVAMKNLAGRTHLQAMLKHVLRPEEVDRIFEVEVEKSKAKLKAISDWPYLGNVRLRDAKPNDVQRLMSAALQRGYSTQTAMHIRNLVGAIFEHARKIQWFTGYNPARLVALPRMTRKQALSLTFTQVQDVLGVMKYPEKELTLFVILTGMYVAEICGLQWKRVNLTEDWSTTGDEAIPPRSVAINKQWYRGEFGNLSRDCRNRNLAIPEALLPVLLTLSQRPKFNGADDFVLVSQNGSPVDGAAIAARRLKPIGKALQMPGLSWHVLQRTHSKLTYELGTRSLCSL